MNSVLAAIEKLYKEIGFEDVLNDIKNDYLTENTCRNGKEVLWYLDENKSVAIYVDSLEFLTEEDIEEQLC